MEPTSAAHVPSGTGRSSWELHSAGRTKTRVHSLRPPGGVHSPGGKLQWPLGQGPGAGGPAWGAGGRGESGAFFVCKVSLNNGCSALSSLLLLLLGSARRRLSLPLPPSSPPALPRPPGPSAGEAGDAGPGTHTHSHWHTQTHAALARPPAPSFLPFSPCSLPPSPPRSLSEPLSEGGPRAGGGWSCPAGPAPSPRARRKSGGREEGLLRKTKEIETRRLGTERIGPGETWTGRRPREAGRETHPPEPHAEVKGGAGLCRLLVSSPSQPTPTPLRLKAGLRSHSELLWRNPRAARWEELWGAGLLYTDPHSEFSLKILEKGGQSRLPRPKPSRVPSPGSEIPFTEHPSGTPPLKPRGC